MKCFARFLTETALAVDVDPAIRRIVAKMQRHTLAMEGFVDGRRKLAAASRLATNASFGMQDQSC